MPVRIERTVCGVLELVNRVGEGGYTERDLQMLEIFARYTSVSIENLLDAQRANEMARRDDLTGLYNDRFFHHRLTEDLVRADVTGGTVALLFLDLDNFKAVNDNHGHLAGSQVLKEFGYLLKQTVDVERATLARYGGDEFVVILPELDLEQAKAVAADVQTALETNPVSPGELLVVRRTGLLAGAPDVFHRGRGLSRPPAPSGNHGYEEEPPAEGRRSRHVRRQGAPVKTRSTSPTSRDRANLADDALVNHRWELWHDDCCYPAGETASAGSRGPRFPGGTMQREKQKYYSLAAIVVAAVLFGMVIAGGLDLTPPADADRHTQVQPVMETIAAPDFATLADRVVPSVVSVTIKDVLDPSDSDSRMPRDPFHEFFRGPQAPSDEPSVRRSAGSGFFISADGEIVTNYHVIEDADRSSSSLPTAFSSTPRSSVVTRRPIWP